jgi:septation ring formation regulator EzrA
MKLSEYKIETSIDKKIDEFGKISDEIDKVKSILDRLTKKYRVIENELRPVLEQLHQQNQKSLLTKKYLVTLKRMGYSRDNYKYKESFEKSLTKVNQQTRRVLEDILQSTKTITTVVSSIGVQRIDEISLKSMLQRVFSSFKRFVSPLKRNTKNIDGLNSILKKMV